MLTEVITHARPWDDPALGVAGLPEDPLGFDLPEDEPVVTTRRALVRLAFVAAETAATFQRDGTAYDPMAWLLAPRRLFGGGTAIEACLGRRECLRALLLHGLGLGLDAAPTSVDALMEPGDLDEDGNDGDGGHAAAGRRLYTAWCVEGDDTGHLQGFGATMALTKREAAAALARHRPAVAKADLRVVEGFDPSAPLAAALLSPAVADMLSRIAADPASPLADGLELFVEQRFAA